MPQLPVCHPIKRQEIAIRGPEGQFANKNLVLLTKVTKLIQG
tara:strand:+ start:180 stop:305 length:126 start_codon:yes stop_codon:yes gene_type:complete